jgi:hypothetical protein
LVYLVAWQSPSSSDNLIDLVRYWRRQKWAKRVASLRRYKWYQTVSVPVIVAIQISVVRVIMPRRLEMVAAGRTLCCCLSLHRNVKGDDGGCVQF